MEERKRMEMERVVTIKEAGGVDQDNVFAVAHLAHVDAEIDIFIYLVYRLLSILLNMYRFSFFFSWWCAYINLIHNKTQKKNNV